MPRSLVLAVVCAGIGARYANGDEPADLAQIAIPLEARAESFGDSGGLDIVRCFVGKVRVGERRFYDKRHGGRAGVMAEEQLFDADGKLHGVCRQFHPNGKLFCEEPYRHGLQDGTFRYWDASGKLRGESLLRNGNGILRRFSLRFITGDNAEIPYVDGKIHGVKTNWGTTPAYGSGPCTFYAEYVHGVQEGWSLTYDSDGTLRISTRYQKGLTHGVIRTFDPKGRLLAGSEMYVMTNPKMSPINGQVSKAEYLAAAEKDAWLMESLKNDGKNVKLVQASVTANAVMIKSTPTNNAETVDTKSPVDSAPMPRATPMEAHAPTVPTASHSTSPITSPLAPTAEGDAHLESPGRSQTLRSYWPVAAILALAVLGATIWRIARSKAS